MFRFTSVLLFSGLGLLLGGLRAQTNVFEKITIEQGLSQGMVFDILQTRDGFLWFATKDGLNRYDGYNFKVFSHDPFDAFSLAGDNVEVLFEDSRGWLWVGTGSKGVDVYDVRTGLFHHINPDFPPTEQLAFTNPRNFVEGKDGAIWVQYYTRGLVRIEIPEAWRAGLPSQPNLGKMTKIVQCPIPGWDTGGEEWISMWTEADGSIAAFSSLRQYRITPDMRAGALEHGGLGPSRIYSAAPDERLGQDGFWLLGESGRLYSFRQGLMSFVAKPVETWEKQMSSLQNIGKGDILLAFGNKIWRLDPQRATDWGQPLWILDREAKSICSDRNGNYWIGTLGYGLRRFNPRFEAFRTGVAGQSVWRLWRSPMGRYFWRNASDIAEYDPLTGTLAPAHPFPELKDYWLRDMVFDPSGAFWVLAAHRSDRNQMHLCRYGATYKQEQCRIYPIRDYSYACFARARNGALWINGAGCQLTRLDPSSGAMTQYSYAHLFGERAPTTQAFAIAEDGNGALWIGTQQGLVKAAPTSQGMDFQLFQADAANPAGLNHNNVSSLLPDPVQPGAILWVGTKGGGLNRLDLRTGRFQHYGLKDGLPDKVIYGILPGNENPKDGPVSLWCSTNRGLAKLTALPSSAPKNGNTQFDVVVYTAAKGLQDNEFNTQSFFKSAQGELLFGGINGLNHFFPERLRPDTALPPVFVVGLEINHLPASVEQLGGSGPRSLQGLRELHLPYHQNNVSFEFAALDFTDPSKNRYRYRLDGLEANWVEAGNDRFAHFTHLAPGRYTFLVQGSNGESRWADAANPITLTIAPPWWRSTLAYCLYCLLLGWGIWQLYRIQIRRVQLREQLAFEHRETERVKALEQLKTNFFSSITHEFRTPLTLMIEPLRQFLQDPKAADGVEKVRTAERNSRQLLGLVNQLLDMAKLESGQMPLDLRQGDLAQTVRTVFENFLSSAEKRGVKLVFRQDSKDLHDVVFDPGKVESILNNLISNALKFTPEGGAVEITIDDLRFTIGASDLAVVGSENPKTKIENRKSKIENQKPKIGIRVSDTGIGIPADQLTKIFDRFYQVDSSHTRAGVGTGIGLALSKELAELMGGGISVESTLGKGSTFSFWLPVEFTNDDLRLTIGASGLDAVETGSPQRPTPNSEIRNPKSEIEKPSLPNSEIRNPKSEIERPIALIIEDNVELRQFIKSSIEGTWDVLETSNGEDGIQKAIALLPDLIISDLMMPKKDGFAVVDTLKHHELTAHIPIILLTAKSGIESKIKGLRQGADDYLTKPFNTGELLARMENLVEIRRRLQAYYRQQASALSVSAVVEKEGAAAPLDQAFLRRFVLLLEHRLADDSLSVEDIAAELHINRTQLHRKLKAITDQNTTDFVRDYRLDRAMTMLKNREGMIHEVAAKVGFANEKYFSRVFKEKFNCSPSQVV